MAKKILFVNQEIEPYVPKNHISTIGQELPRAAQEAGFEIRTFMPKWGNINERRGQLHEVIRLSGMNLVIDNTDHPLIIKVASIPVSRIQVYFIDNDDYFTKKQMYSDDSGQEYYDNGERAIFFARGVLETVKKLRWSPDLIVCQGWISAVLPLYIKTAYKDEPAFSQSKVATILYEPQLTQNFNKNFVNSLEFKNVSNELLKKYEQEFTPLELGKLAVDYSDGLIFGSHEIIPELAEYANSKGLPTLPCPQEEPAKVYADFLAKLIDNE